MAPVSPMTNHRSIPMTCLLGKTPPPLKASASAFVKSLGKHGTLGNVVPENTIPIPHVSNTGERNPHIALENILYGHKSFSGDVRLAHINQVASIHPVLNLNADFFTLQRLQNLVKGFYFDQGRGILRSRHQTSP